LGPEVDACSKARDISREIVMNNEIVHEIARDRASIARAIAAV
jgi:hypothetical protein